MSLRENAPRIEGNVIHATRAEVRRMDAVGRKLFSQLRNSGFSEVAYYREVSAILDIPPNLLEDQPDAWNLQVVASIADDAT